MPIDKILYERNHVIIKERSSQSQTQETPLDEITGTMTIIENERGRFLRFVPLGLEDVMTDDWALINGGHSVVCQKNDGDSVAQSSSPLLKYRFIFNLNDLRSVRRHHMLRGIAHMVFILKDGTTLPAFYFNLGGSKELLQKLAQYLRLEKSIQDSRLYIVKDDLPRDRRPQSTSVFDQMNLFDNSSDTMRRIRGNDPRRTAVERFSKVTHFLKDAFLGQDDIISSNDVDTEGLFGPDLTALLDSMNGDLRETNNDGFEVIYKVDFKKPPEVARGQPVTSKEWQMAFDKDGRITDVEKMKERIFRGGLESNALRREAWKFLLNYYSWTSTREERAQTAKQRKSEYHSMKVQWKSMNDQQKQRNASFRDRESLIDKDVARTDRTHEFYQEDNNIHLVMLHDVLMTYNMFNFDLGYVQGMNDLLSPILIVMEDEVDAFWCFVGLMSRMEQNFYLDQTHIKRQLGNLHTILQFIDAELANYLTENNSNNMYFFFRWMLICFKREFSFDDVMHLWEVLWTDHLCQNFELLVCLAILMSQKTVIMESKFGCNEILKHFNELAFKVPLKPMLKQAESYHLLLKQCRRKQTNFPPPISAPLPVTKKELNLFFNDLSCNLDLDTCLLSAEKLYIQLATHRDIPTAIAKILGLPTGPNQQLPIATEGITYPRKVYTQQPRGTMNLDNSYFRQDSEPSLIPSQQETAASTALDDLLTMTPLMEL
ncbi:unnamed protein product [Adineta ricciae]|uniref:Rab-GAP TBC domain-containing protein n=1 Tax=Adineta ricciae TaxID=249248 RepID=A0A815XIZ1_ADIRI|nr:unnamed protein product [Adineta ricciae]